MKADWPELETIRLQEHCLTHPSYQDNREGQSPQLLSLQQKFKIPIEY